MRITANQPTHPTVNPLSQTLGRMKRVAGRIHSREAGVTLVETIISLMVIVIGLAGLFTTAGQAFRLLRRSKELVTVRECMLTRIDSIRALSFTEVARPVLPAGNKTTSGSLSTSVMNTDPNSFGGSLTGMKNFTETVNVYALGGQIFSNDTQRQNATPDYQYEYASQIDSVAPAAPKTYKSNSQAQGDWTLQVANALPYYQITRAGIGASAVVTVDTTGCASTLSPNDLSGYPALLIDITYSWTDSSNVTRTQVGSMILSKNGSLQ